MQIERGVTGVTTLGPGSRLVVWVNGCNRRCRGCISERLQAFDPENEYDIEAFLRGFDLSRIDGVTISGGEPFEQAPELAKLIRLLRRKGVTDILVYTGYTLEELRARGDGATDEALSGISVLIDGPYVAELDDGTDNIKGSKNQRVLFLKPGFEKKYSEYIRPERSMQQMPLANILLAAGFPPAGFAERFINDDEEGEDEV